jgi:FlaA1/EpsC-like NDP-sugar epimerase
MMTQRFQDRVVFVTGGTSGLGAEICELFINERAKVFVTDIQVIYMIFSYQFDLTLTLTTVFKYTEGGLTSPFV